MSPRRFLRSAARAISVRRSTRNESSLEPASPAASPPAEPDVPEGEHVIGPRSHPLRIRAVQEMVNAATTQKVAVDGIYGDATRSAVAFLQRRLGLPADGRADALTLVLGQARIEAQVAARQSLRQVVLTMPPGSRTKHLLMRAERQLYIPRILEEQGLAGYEPETLAVWLAACELLPVGPVLDIGANVGVFAALAAACTDREVVAFEPTPVLADTLRRVAVENHLRIDVEQAALSAASGVATLYLSRVSDASNSLAPDFRPSDVSLPVRSTTLDDWNERSREAPVLLKVDTETTEADVLAGGLAGIRTHRPWILCELLPGERAQDVPRLLKDLGYHYFHITSELPAVEHETPDPDETHRNWLLTPDPVQVAFWEAAQRWHSALLQCGGTQQ